MSSDGPLFIGVDGGGTGCRARLTDAAGLILGEGISGPANIATDLAGAARSIGEAAASAARSAGLPLDALERATAGFGLAGGNAPDKVADLARCPFPFRSVRIASDAEAACLGAHGGGEGGILIVGTGSQGACLRGGRTITIGGWGFALSDTGSGAILGRGAARRALAAHEGLEPATAFTRAVMNRFADSPATMLAWALKAVPRDWGELAPAVFEHSALGDPVARGLLDGAVRDVGVLLDRLVALGAERIALMGGMAAPYRPHLPTRFDAVLVSPMGDALDGALALAGLRRSGP